MKVFTMFTGVGAPEQAIKNLGLDWEIVGYSEIDKYAIQTYEKNFPGGVNYGDATTINETELPDFDMLIGGFPCQAFSVAGRRGGFADTRGTLFFDIARIARHKRPTYLVLENVKGLLSHDSGKTFSTILRVLSETGYDVSWSIHNSKDYGVPQNRERIYIIGHLRGTPRPQVLPIGGNDGSTLKYVGGILTDKSKQWLEDGKQFSRNFPQGNRVYGSDGVSSTLASQAGGLGAKTGLYKIVAQRGRGEPPVQTLEPRDDCLTNSLTSVQKDNMVAVDLTRREESRYRVRKDGRAGTLDANYFKGLANQERPGVLEGIRIRRLTPLECERLQGFPDGHTEGVSDTQRYKQMGNSMTVQVMEHILRELK